MYFHAFYNLDGVGDVLLIRLNDHKTNHYIKNKDLVTLYNEKDEAIGFNVLNSSQYFSKLNNGLVKLTDQFVDEIYKFFKDNNINNIIIDKTDKFVVGKVLKKESHPDSDHLNVCQVDVGDEVLQIVCGASNVEENILVVVAKVGAVMPNGMLIKPSFLRKVSSNGMLCSKRELGIQSTTKKGIMILTSDHKVGEPFKREEY